MASQQMVNWVIRCCKTDSDLTEVIRLLKQELLKRKQARASVKYKKNATNL